MRQMARTTPSPSSVVVRSRQASRSVSGTAGTGWLWILLALAPVTLLLAVACGGPAIDRSSTLTVLSTTDERFANQFYWDMPEMFALFLPLTAENERGERVGRLARRWEHSPDFRTWTITLRSDVRWHDGVPVTAHDIKFTSDLRSHPAVHAVAPGTVEVTVVDDTTFTLTIHRRTNVSPLSTWWVYYPKHLLEGLDPAQVQEWDFWQRPVGNGPYRYVRHVPRTMT